MMCRSRPCSLRPPTPGPAGPATVLLRLPHQVKDLFEDWLRRNFPQRAAHVESQIRQTHGGQLYDARFGVRQLGEGPLAQHIGDIFRVCAARSGLAGEASAPSGASFRRPCGGQMNLFFD